MGFVPIFLLNERNVTTSLLMIHLKFTVAYYANLNQSSINKPLLNYRLSNMVFGFFWFLIYVYLKEAFVKRFMKELSLLITSSKIMVYDNILGSDKPWPLSGGP